MLKIIKSSFIIVGVILVGWWLKDFTIKDVNAIDSRFETIVTGSGFYVVYDKETKVEYVVSDRYYNSGTFTLLVNADGKPLLYGEE